MKKSFYYFFAVFIFIVVSLMFSPREIFAKYCDVNKLSYARFGQRGENIKAAQDCLIQLGYDIPHGPTGYFGKQTSVVIKQFYKDILGMDWSSTFGPKAISALKKIIASKSFAKIGNIQKFSSKEEFKYYLSKTQEQSGYFVRTFQTFGTESVSVADMAVGMGGEALSAPPANAVAEKSAERVSETNVQVAGIDEPDIIKTDGTRIYFSSEDVYYIRPLPVMRIRAPISDIAPPQKTAKTRIIKAFPPAESVLENNIDDTGDLLLLKDKKILAVIGNNEINGYDLSDPKNPQKKWNLKFEDNNYLLTARLFNDKIYLVTKQNKKEALD